MSGKRVPRASLIRSNVRSLNFPSLSPSHSLTQFLICAISHSVTLSVSFLFANRTLQQHQQQQLHHFRPSHEYLSLAITQIVLHIFRIHNSVFSPLTQPLCHQVGKRASNPVSLTVSPPLLAPPTCHHSALLLIVCSLSWGHFVAKLKLLLIKYNFCLLSSWPTFQECADHFDHAQNVQFCSH